MDPERPGRLWRNRNPGDENLGCSFAADTTHTTGKKLAFAEAKTQPKNTKRIEVVQGPTATRRKQTGKHMFDNAGRLAFLSWSGRELEVEEV